ncbi:hypothetical protein AB6A40_002893 [Gnathostoma spinigerum]|uniref:Uncharacterized protein n=1 Tax=Gnathostoma spinigerum TaxID=75299 RepID=A0ABD6E7X4_9BILA
MFGSGSQISPFHEVNAVPNCHSYEYLPRYLRISLATYRQQAVITLFFTRCKSGRPSALLNGVAGVPSSPNACPVTLVRSNTRWYEWVGPKVKVVALVEMVLYYGLTEQPTLSHIDHESQNKLFFDPEVP